MQPALSWIQEFHNSFNRAADCSRGFSIEEGPNPLVKHVIFHLSEPLTGGNYRPFQTLAHAFAKANNCTLERIYNKRDRLILVVGMKRRLGPEKRINPLLSDKPSPFKKGY